MRKKEWVICPICKQKTRTQICSDTVLINFPLFCPKCKKETLISIKNQKIIVHQEPDA